MHYTILDISADRQLDKDFVAYGLDCEAALPQGVRSFQESEEALLRKEGNFFFEAGGQFKGFLAKGLDDKPIGRIGAMHHAGIIGEPAVGLVGLFHCIENYTVAKALLDKAIAWLKNAGCKKILGPMDFSIWHRYRFAIDGFGGAPFIGEPRNPTYYPSFFEQYGFKTINEWQSVVLDRATMAKMAKVCSPHTALAKELGYERVSFTHHNQDELMAAVHDIISSAYRFFPAYSPISKAQFMQQFAHLPRLVDRQLAYFIKNPSGQYVGFMLVLQDLVPALRAMQGETNWWAKLKFAYHARKGSMINISQGAIRPEAIREAAKLGLAHKGQGFSLTRAAFHHVFGRALASNRYDKAVVSLMREGAFIQTHVADYKSKIRRHRLYEWVGKV